MAPRHWVLLVAALLFLWKLGGHDLWAPDEPYFAEGAREMVVDGRWAVPHVNGVVTTDKPPLFFWLIALFSLPAGEVTSWTARLPSVLAALATLALTLRLGRRLYGPRTAPLAGAVLMVSFLFWDKARWSQTDALLCCCIWIALSAFEAVRAGDADGRRAGLLFWLAAAAAVLTKGPVGLLLPLGIALVTLGIDRRIGRWRGFAPYSGPLLFAVVIGGWMTLATVGGHGEYSVWGAFREHFFERAIHGMHHRQPPWYFLEAVPVNLLPWTGLLPGALVLAWRRRLPADRFALVASLFVVVFFSISTEKRELYALPAFPAFALLIAGLLAAVCGWDEPRREGSGDGWKPDRRWVTVGQGIVGGFCLALALALPIAARRVEEVRPWMAWVAAAVLAAAGVAALILAWRRRPLASSLVPAAGFAVLYLFAVTVVYPRFEPSKSARPFSVRLAEVTAGSRAAGLPVVAFDLSNLPEAFSFYSNGVYTKELEDPAALARHFDRREQVFAAVNGSRIDDLPPRLLKRLWVVDETELSHRDVLLVTNGRAPGARPLIQTLPPSPPESEKTPPSGRRGAPRGAGRAPDREAG